MRFTKKQKEFNERLKRHHFGEEERNSEICITVSRHDLLKSVCFFSLNF